MFESYPLLVIHKRCVNGDKAETEVLKNHMDLQQT